MLSSELKSLLEQTVALLEKTASPDDLSEDVYTDLRPLFLKITDELNSLKYALSEDLEEQTGEYWSSSSLDC